LLAKVSAVAAVVVLAAISEDKHDVVEELARFCCGRGRVVDGFVSGELNNALK
jgi:hypothetical protein